MSNIIRAYIQIEKFLLGYVYIKLYIVVENKKKTRPTNKLITKDLRKKIKNTNSLVGLCYGHLSITSGKALYSVQDSQKVRRLPPLRPVSLRDYLHTESVCCNNSMVWCCIIVDHTFMYFYFFVDINLN